MSQKSMLGAQNKMLKEKKKKKKLILYIWNYNYFVHFDWLFPCVRSLIFALNAPPGGTKNSAEENERKNLLNNYNATIMRLLHK